MVSSGVIPANAIGSWFIQALAGITPDETTPGYKHVNIRPQMVEGIHWVKASKDTPYGMIKVDWRLEGNSLVMEVDIPIGCTATVYLPDGRVKELTSGKHHIS